MNRRPIETEKRGQEILMLDIDSANLYAEHVGREGISAADLQSLGGRPREAHRSLVEKTRNGLETEFACLNLHEQMPPELPGIQKMAEDIRRFSDAVIIGIGGSSLGAKAVHHALAGTDSGQGPTRLHFAENVDAHSIHRLLSRLAPDRTALVCISKSGTTMETVVLFLTLRDWLTRRLGAEQARRQQWVITDPERGWLRNLATREGIPSLDVPPRVGGRFSVLTPVGLLPLAIAGIDVAALLEGAAANAARCAADSINENPALEIAAMSFLLHTRKHKGLSIFMPYVDRLRSFADWYRQLWAESLGKRAADGVPAGTLPVPALGAVDQHSQLQMYLESRLDKVFSFLAVADPGPDAPIPLDDATRAEFPHLEGRNISDILDAEFRATRQVITETGHPNMTITLPAVDAHGLGQLIDLYQRVTVYAGLLYGINPLDQPAVEKGKKLAVASLKEMST